MMPADPGETAHEAVLLLERRCPNGHPFAEGTTLCPTCGTFVSDVPTVPATMPQVAGYEIVRELGRGGMGVVYLARHVRLQRHVALKMILAGAFADRDLQQRFQREAEAVARLQHPGIVQLYEIGEAAGRAYFALEYIAGATLAERLRGTPLLPRRAAELVLALAKGVDYAHTHGIIHRDLKPANILIAGAANLPAEHWIPKIADFGLAKRLDDITHTQSGAILGTPSYMAPEQASGALDRIGPVTDIYALGAILYETLTGRPPFLAPTAPAVISQVVHDDPPSLRRLQASVPRDLETICLKALHKKPIQRYGSAAALAEDLQNYLDGLPIQARRIGPIERAAKWVRRHPAAASVWASLVLFVLLGVVAVWLYNAGVETTRKQTHARSVVQSLSQVETAALPELLDQLNDVRTWADPLLWKMRDEAPRDSKDCLHASLALLPVDSGQIEYLSERIPSADFAALPAMQTLLAPCESQITPKLWNIVTADKKSEERLRAACLLAGYAPIDPRWHNTAIALVEPLLLAVQQNPSHFGTLARSLKPVRDELHEPLATIFRARERSEIDRSFATNFLADFNADRPEVLAELFLDGEETSWSSCSRSSPITPRSPQEFGRKRLLSRMLTRRLNRNAGTFARQTPALDFFGYNAAPRSGRFSSITPIQRCAADCCSGSDRSASILISSLSVSIRSRMLPHAGRCCGRWARSVWKR